MATETLAYKAIVEGVSTFVSDVAKTAKAFQDAAKKVEQSGGDFDKAAGNIDTLTGSLDSASSAAKNVKLDDAGKQAKDVGKDFTEAAPDVETLGTSLEETQDKAEDFDAAPAGENAETAGQAVADAGETAEGFSESLDTVETAAGAFDVSDASEQAETVAQGISDAGETAEGFSDALDTVEQDAGAFDPSAAADSAESTAAGVGDAGADAERFSDSLDTVQGDADAFDIDSAADTAESTATAIGDAGSDAERFSDSLDTVQGDADSFDVSGAASSAEDTASAIGDAGADAERFSESLEIVEGDADAFDPGAAVDSAESTATDIGDAGADAERFSESLFIVEDDADSFDPGAAADSAEDTASAVGDAGEDAERFSDSLDTVQDDADAFDVSSAADTATETAQEIGDAGDDVEPFGQALEDVERMASELDLSAASAEADTTATDFSDAATEIEELSGALDNAQAAAEEVDLSGVTDNLGGVEEAAGETRSTFDTVGTSATTMGTLLAGASTKADGLTSSFGGLKTAIAGITVTAAIVSIGGFLTDAANAALADEQATIRLETAIRNTHAPFEETVALLDAMIASGQKLAFTDDEVRDSFALLLIATESAQEATKRLAIAFDFARGQGISLEAASRLLGKVNEENVDIFKKMGIEMDANATEAEALAKINELYAGQADSFAKSTAGQFDVAKIKTDELKETIGTQLLPVMALALEAANKGADGWAEYSDKVSSRVAGSTLSIAENVKATQDMADAQVEAVKKLIGLGQAAEETTPPVKDLAAAVAFEKQQTELADKATKDLTLSLKDMQQQFVDANPKVIAAKGQMALYRLELSDLETKSGDLTAAEKERIDQLNTSIGVLENVIAKEQGHADAVQDVTGYLATFAGEAGMARIIKVLGDGATSTDAQTKAVQTLGQAFIAAKDGGVDPAISAMQDLQSELGPMSAEWQEIAKTIGPEFVETILTGVTDPARREELVQAGVDLGFATSEGAESTAADLENAGAILGAAMKTGVSSVSTVGVGEDLARGVELGIANKRGAVIAAAQALAQSVLGIMRSATRSESPSQEAEDIGEDIDRGLEQGLNNRLVFVQLVTEGLMQDAVLDPLLAGSVEAKAIGTAIGLTATEAIAFAFKTGAPDAYEQLDAFLGTLTDDMVTAKEKLGLEATRSVIGMVDAFAETNKYKPATDQVFEFSHLLVNIMHDANLPAAAKAEIQAAITQIMSDLHAGKIDAESAMVAVKDAMVGVIVEAGAEIEAKANVVNNKIADKLDEFATLLATNLKAKKEMSVGELGALFDSLDALIDGSTLGPKSKALASEIVNEFINGLRSGQGAANGAIIDFINFLTKQLTSLPTTPGGSGSGGGSSPIPKPPANTPDNQTAESMIWRATGIWPSQYGWDTPFSKPVYDTYGNKVGARVADFIVSALESGGRPMQINGVLTLGPSGKPEGGYWHDGTWNGRTPPEYLAKGGFIVGERGNEAVIPLDQFYRKLDDLIAVSALVALNTSPIPMFGGPRSTQSSSNSLLFDLRGSTFGSDADSTAAALFREVDKRFDVNMQRHMAGAFRNGVRAKL